MFNRVTKITALSASLAMFTFGTMGASANECACVCLDGVKTTLCTSVADAQDNSSMCAKSAQTAACPTSGAPLNEKGSVESPHADATGCRVASVWSNDTQAYSIEVNVCDLTG